MTQIANITFNVTGGGSPSTRTVVPWWAKKDDAEWRENVLPEVIRLRSQFLVRPPSKESPLTRYSLRITVPTLKSIVTDPSGPYEPQPVVDYDTVGEIVLWAHSRATQAEREAAYFALLGNPSASLLTTFHTAAVLGQPIYG